MSSTWWFYFFPPLPCNLKTISWLSLTNLHNPKVNVLSFLTLERHQVFLQMLHVIKFIYFHLSMRNGRMDVLGIVRNWRNPRGIFNSWTNLVTAIKNSNSVPTRSSWATIGARAKSAAFKNNSISFRFYLIEQGTNCRPWRTHRWKAPACYGTIVLHKNKWNVLCCFSLSVCV